MKAAKMRGISPIVAVLLLILVAIGAAVLIYLWLTGFAGKSTQTPSSLQTQFKIETARILNGTGALPVSQNTANATIDIYLRNTGRTSIDLGALQEENALAIYIYNSYTGDLVYSNTTLLKIVKNVPATDPTKNIIIADGNENGVWEPGELLHIEFADPVYGWTGSTDGNLFLSAGKLNITLSCGHYYDIKVVIAGQSDTIQNVRVNCQKAQG